VDDQRGVPGIWLSPGVKAAEQYFKEWYGWAIRSRLEPVKKVARMCKTHVGNILTFFVHRLPMVPSKVSTTKSKG